jgi:hypothetical protein
MQLQLAPLNFCLAINNKSAIKNCIAQEIEIEDVYNPSLFEKTIG